MNRIKAKDFLNKISQELRLPEQLPKLQEQVDKILQDRNKLILAVLAILIFLLLDLSLVLRSQTRALGAVNSKVKKLSSDLKFLNADIIRMQRQEKGLVTEQEKNIVSGDQLPWVIEEISRLANQQEVRIFQIKPVRELPSARMAKRSQSPDPDKHTPFLIDLEACGGYHQLGRFLAEVESHPIFLKVEELDIKQDNEAGFEHKIKLRLKTYVSEEE